MKRLLLAALLASSSALAQTTCVTTAAGTACINEAPSYCSTPSMWDPIRHQCVPPSPAPGGPTLFPVCNVSVSYPAGDPLSAQLTVTPGCDSGAVEYALQAAITRLRWSQGR